MSSTSPVPGTASAPSPASGDSTREYLPFLDVARVVAVLGVVAIHVIGGGVSSGQSGIALVALDMALIAAVPVFFMMSGALSLDPRALRRGPADFLRRRAARILPALVVWSLFYVLAVRMVLSEQRFTGPDVLDMLVGGDAYTHLYFLWAIAGLYLLTPVLQPFLQVDEGRRGWILGLAAAGWTVLVMALGQLAALELLPAAPLTAGATTFALMYVGYFVLGRAMLVSPLPRHAAWAALASAPLFVALLTWLYEALRDQRDVATPDPWIAMLAPSYVSLPTVLYAVLLMAAVSSLCRGWRVSERTGRILRRLGEATFGVFLVHFAVLAGLRVVPWLATFDPAPMAVCFVVTIALSTAFALIGARIPGLRRIL
ncbi:acyltransferase [Brachybacterium sp. J144]|uniref:acyltransferase n=1 Tax=Brachybacterium sp. J144 TaxID=3116487 RepID=UPI002E75E6C0|nr:acyltransferase [Brachybacterium sp. J144]MEE1649576.1 acyltransferase [Brachybacterium sp. J144]